MAKLKLIANPTFEASVDIPVHGGAAVPVNFQFRHRTRTEITAWLDTVKGKSDAEVIMDVAIGWELDDEFTQENAERLAENYNGAGVAVLEKYLAEIGQARAKN